MYILYIFIYTLLYLRSDLARYSWRALEVAAEIDIPTWLLLLFKNIYAGIHNV